MKLNLLRKYFATLRRAKFCRCGRLLPLKIIPHAAARAMFEPEVHEFQDNVVSKVSLIMWKQGKSIEWRRSAAHRIEPNSHRSIARINWWNFEKKSHSRRFRFQFLSVQFHENICRNRSSRWFISGLKFFLGAFLTHFTRCELLPRV